MRQRSAFQQTAPLFSLPQRSIIVPSTQADALEEQQAKTRSNTSSPWPEDQAVEDDDWNDDDCTYEDTPPQASSRRIPQMLALEPIRPSTALTRPLDVPTDLPSLADLRLIPATNPLPRVKGRQQRWGHVGPAPRITFRKLVLFGAVLFAVMTATLATAGGGPVLNFLFSTFRMASPSSAAVSLVGGAVAERVHPITQANSDAGYDSPEQHDAWWDSVCAAAAFTEVAHAWGITNAKLGQVIDRLVAHNPPYITTWGGLMTQDGWPWMAAAYHLHADVTWHTYTFDTLVQRVNSTGIPIIIGMDASSWGHFVVVVGGDNNQAQIVDSSTWRMTSLPRSYFSGPTSGIINEPIWWSGETVTLTPI